MAVLVVQTQLESHLWKSVRANLWRCRLFFSPRGLLFLLDVGMASQDSEILLNMATNGDDSQVFAMAEDDLQGNGGNDKVKYKVA